MVIMARSSAWSVMVGGLKSEHGFIFCLTTESVRKTDSVDGLSLSQDAVICIVTRLRPTQSRF
jgi:hypothetical protein